MSLEYDRCGECHEDPCVCGGERYSEEEEGEGEVHENRYIASVEKRTPNLRRTQKRLFIDMVEDEDHPVVSQGAAGKRPAHLSQRFEEEEEAEAHPDLAEYFAMFDLAPQQVIAMCRTYANCLAATLRAAKSLERKTKD